MVNKDGFVRFSAEGVFDFVGWVGVRGSWVLKDVWMFVSCLRLVVGGVF